MCIRDSPHLPGASLRVLQAAPDLGGAADVHLVVRQNVGGVADLPGAWAAIAGVPGFFPFHHDL